MAAPNPLLLDYLFLQPLIVARLSAEVADLDQVDGIEELATATEAKVIGTRAFVLWDGETFAGDSGRAGGGSRQIVTQTWSVLLAVRNASQVDPAARNASGGVHLSNIHKALAGWTPQGTYRPFVRTNGRKPNYRANVALYPLTFSIDLTL